MYIITLDTGTTNTRVTLWQDRIVKIRASREVGVRDTAVDGNNERLKAGVREAIRDVLNRSYISLDDVEVILASGMITSNVGLVEVPHLYAPAGKDELAENIAKRYLPDVIDKDIWFVPGIKNNIKEVTLENCEEMDIMRGEEAETISLIQRLNIQGPALIILPGSHSKYVSVDHNNKITGCLTSLAGELVSVITNHTILANALNKSFVSEFKKQYVLKGYDYSKRSGLSRTCFTIRILDQFTDLSYNDKANILLGIVLADDLKAIKNSKALTVSHDSKVYIAGKDILRDCLETLIREDNYFTSVKTVKSEELADLAGYGAICLAAHRGLLLK